MIEIIMTIISGIRDLWIDMGLEDENGGPIWALLQSERDLVDLLAFFGGRDNQPFWAYSRNGSWLPVIDETLIAIDEMAENVLTEVRRSPRENEMRALIVKLHKALDELYKDFVDDPPQVKDRD